MPAERSFGFDTLQIHAGQRVDETTGARAQPMLIAFNTLAEIGAHGIALSPDVAAVERTHEQLHDFIQGCCRVHLSGLLTGLEALSSRDVEQRSNEIYEAAFSLIGDAGEDAR